MAAHTSPLQVDNVIIIIVIIFNIIVDIIIIGIIINNTTTITELEKVGVLQLTGFPDLFHVKIESFGENSEILVKLENFASKVENLCLNIQNFLSKTKLFPTMQDPHQVGGHQRGGVCIQVGPKWWTWTWTWTGCCLTRLALHFNHTAAS